MIAACLALTGYFLEHTFQGGYGLTRNSELSKRTALLAAEIAELEVQRQRLERDVALLRGNPHPDMVEELGRTVLGYAYPDARVFQESGRSR